MTNPSATKRQLLKGAGLLGAATGLDAFRLADAAETASKAAADLMAVPDTGWALWLDRDAKWQDDVIYLPADVPAFSTLPVNAPTGGWDALYKAKSIDVTLPTTVEEHCWGQFGLKPYAADEYKYAGKEDPAPQNGAYVGVSWWSRSIDIPATAKGRQVWLHLRGARFRAEVYLNEKLVGYSIMSELPFDCDLSGAMLPGGPNRLAIRVTNPGGTYDWRDYTSLQWAAARFYPGHGFGGLDRGLSLSVHPAAGRISEAWVLNTPEPRTVTAYVELDVKGKADPDALAKQITVSVADTKGTPVAADIALLGVEAKDGRVTARFKVHAAAAKLWDLDAPNLYRVTARWTQSRKTVRFGFRWYSIDGLGKAALLRLNGRRIKLYSAISWGFWGYNGLWPTPELARREVTSAKALGLNSLSFHRNLGRREVLDAQDEMGLTRTMEPGAGEHAIGRPAKPGQTPSAGETFDRDFMSARCEAMVKAFRSHPSLLQYTLQNEIVGDLGNPGVERVLRLMHAADPSRTVILDDGFNARGDAQAMMTPYSDHFYRSDAEAFPAAGWWGQHQNAGDQWYDRFYASKDSFVHRQTITDSIVELGEMQGCAVCDNHVKMVADILRHGGQKKPGTSYDLQDHQEVVAAYNTFLDRWGFRDAFPTTEGLFLSIGAKQYGSWHQYLENIRISDQVDMTAISGWETTAIENHSGIVDNLRYFHGDPDLLKSSLLPVRPVAKQRALTYAVGEFAALDIWLLNDTAKPVNGTLTLSVTAPDGRTVKLATYAAPANVADQFSYLLAENVATPAFASEGKHRIRLELSGHPEATFIRDLWVVNTAIKPFQTAPRIALSGVSHALRVKLAKIDGVTFEDFQAGKSYDGIVSSGLSAQEITDREAAEVSVGDPKAKTAVAGAPGEIAPEVLASVKAGTPLLVLAPEEKLADGIARQLADLNLFSYAGQVGAIRASWMGSWHFLRRHALFDGIPADMAANTWHQVPAGGSNGLLIDGDGIEIMAAYSRDHDRKIGASSFTVRKAGMKLLFHRMPDMAPALQKRWLINALHWLADKGA